MKIFLTLFVILIISACTSISAKDNNIVDPKPIPVKSETQSLKTSMDLILLNISYKKAKNEIISYCEQDSEHIKTMAESRDLGYPLDDILNLVIHAADVSEENLETQVVLYEMLTIIMVYDRKEYSPDEIYEMSYASCTDKTLKQLEEIYIYRKDLIEN